MWLACGRPALSGEHAAQCQGHGHPHRVSMQVLLHGVPSYRNIRMPPWQRHDRTEQCRGVPWQP